MQLTKFIKLGIYLIRNIPYFDERHTYKAKKRGLDLSVKWFQLMFRKIKLKMHNEGIIDIYEYS